MGVWKIFVNFLAPPPIILTFIIVLPLPTATRKAVLLATEKFLTFYIAGSVQLVHIMIAVTGVVFSASVQTTYQLNNAAHDETLTPNQRTAVLAKKWREERNFWIAFTTFILWCLLARLCQIISETIDLEEKTRRYAEQLGLIPPKVPPQSLGDKAKGLFNFSKKKAGIKDKASAASGTSSAAAEATSTDSTFLAQHAAEPSAPPIIELTDQFIEAIEPKKEL